MQCAYVYICCVLGFSGHGRKMVNLVVNFVTCSYSFSFNSEWNFFHSKFQKKLLKQHLAYIPVWLFSVKNSIVELIYVNVDSLTFHSISLDLNEKQQMCFKSKCILRASACNKKERKQPWV
jgi:hypothetical protein